VAQRRDVLPGLHALAHENEQVVGERLDARLYDVDAGIADAPHAGGGQVERFVRWPFHLAE